MGMSGTTRRRSSVPRAPERGMSLVEAMIAMVVIAVALLALLSLITSAGTIQDDSRERTLAYNAARQKIEEMRALITASKIYDAYKKGGTIGNLFVVDGMPVGTGANLSTNVTLDNGTVKALSVPSHGTIIFSEDVPGADAITENPTNAVLRAQFGMPKDLNRDGDTADTALALNSVGILPVKVLVQWRTSANKVNQVEVVTFIVEK